MKTCLVAFAIVAAVTARRAHACDQGSSNNISTGVALLGIGYAGATLAFSVNDLATNDHSQGYAIAEVGFNVPAAALAAWIEYDLPNTSSYDTPKLVIGGLLALHVALSIHGFYTLHSLANKSDAPPYTGPPGAFRVGSVQGVVTPVPINGGGALGLAGVF